MGSEIPAEILCEIFHLLCNEPVALHDLKNNLHFDEFPWAVGQVNRHWRGAFQSYPPLWTSFSLRPGIFSASYFTEMNRRAAIYLERSGQQPLTVAAFMTCSASERFPKTVWTMLLSLLKRWKKANLVLGLGAALDEILRCRGYMSSLESLEMLVSANGTLKSYDAFQDAPHLTKLSLTHHKDTAKWQFPWAQLIKLRIDASHSEFLLNYSLWEVLFELQNIEELHIITDFRSRSPRFSKLEAMASLPRLRFLEITLAFSMMLSWFTAPLLEHLHIRGCSDNREYYFHDRQPYERELTSLIQRSSCHVRQLTLQGCRSKESRIMMKALTGVEELFIMTPPFVEIAIRDMTELDCICLPELRVLRVKSGCLYKNAAAEKAVTAFSDFLDMRGKGLPLLRHGVVPLQKVVVWFTFREQLPESVVETMRNWPSFVEAYVNDLAIERPSTPST